MRALGPTMLALVAGVLVPSQASAWADATVRTARARVVLSPDGTTLHVELTADVRVDRGWLEGFELDGLDEGLALDPDRPPTFERWAMPEVTPPVPVTPPEVAEEASPSAEVAPPTTAEVEPVHVEPIFVERLEPSVSVNGSRIGWAFRRRHAPRAGLYRATVSYLAPSEGHITRAPDGAELSWTLPAWRFGLDGVEVVLVLPEGSSPAALTEEDESAIGISPAELVEGETGLAFRYVRVHLPRTQSWTVRAALGEQFFAAPEIVTEPEAIPAAGPTERPVAPAMVVVAILAVLVVAKSRAREREASEADASSGAVTFGSARLVLAMALAAAWAGWALAFLRPELVPLALGVIAVLGAHRAANHAPLRLGSFRSAWGRHVRAAQAKTSPLSWPDLTDAHRPLGAALLGLGLAASFAMERLGWLSRADAVVAGAALAVIQITGAGSARPSTPRARLATLLAWASGFAPALEHELALAPVVHVDIRGRVQAARLRLMWAGALDGLVRSDVTVVGRGLALIIAARRKTDAERALLLFAAEHGVAAHQTEERSAIQLEVRDVPLAVAALRARPASTEILAKAS